MRALWIQPQRQEPFDTRSPYLGMRILTLWHGANASGLQFRGSLFFSLDLMVRISEVNSFVVAISAVFAAVDHGGSVIGLGVFSEVFD